MSTQIATRPDQPDLRSIVTSDKIKRQLLDALPTYYTPDRFAICVRTAINKTPKLLDCAPESVLVAMLTAAQMGILPDGRNGHLIPYGNQCQFIPDFKGLVALVRRNDNVSDVYADLVKENDTFRITKGLHRDLVHEIDIRKPRGETVGAYAVLQYKDGTTSFEFMSAEDIEAIRKRSRSANNGPWVTDTGEMYKKTVIKRLLKLADLSPETHERLAVDIESEVTHPEQRLEIQRPTISKPAAARQIEDRQEAEPSQETQEQASNDSEPKAEEPATEEKPKLTRKPKPKKEEPVQQEVATEPESKKEAPAADTIEAKVSKRLETGGFTSGDLFRVALENEWIADVDPDAAPLSAFGDAALQQFDEEWENGPPGDRLLDVLVEKKKEREGGK